MYEKVQIGQVDSKYRIFYRSKKRPNESEGTNICQIEKMSNGLGGTNISKKKSRLIKDDQIRQVRSLNRLITTKY